MNQRKRRMAATQAAVLAAGLGDPEECRLAVSPPIDGQAMVFFALGCPVPQPRARITVRGGVGRGYVPAAHAIHAWRAEVAASCREAIRRTISGPTALAIELICPRPKSHWTKGGSLSRAGQRSEEPPGDWDNYAKAIQDAMVDAAALEDDRAVVGPNVVWKRWADREETAGAVVWIAPARSVWCRWGACKAV